MAQFQYTAKQGLGKSQSGMIEAATYRDAVAKILAQGLTPVSVISLEPSSQKTKQKTASRKSSADAGSGSFFQSDLVMFTRYLADFLAADVPLLRALELIRGYFLKGRIAAVLPGMIEHVRDGDSLSEGLARYPHIFSSLYVNMVRAGEASGALVEVAGRLADFLERDRDLRVVFLTSLMYPAMILVVACIIVFVLLSFVIPRIAVVFQDMNQTLPVMTRILVAVSAVFSHFWWLILIVLAVSGTVCWRWYQTREGRIAVDRAIIRFPWVGQLIRQVAIARFARTLSTLIEGGVEIVPALEYSGYVVHDGTYRLELLSVADKVGSGDSLSSALNATTLFSQADISMLSVGEETGGLSRGLAKLADFYEKNSRQMMNAAATLIEPGLILVLSFFVGFIVMALLMPIFNMNLVIH